MSILLRLITFVSIVLIFTPLHAQISFEVQGLTTDQQQQLQNKDPSLSQNCQTIDDQQVCTLTKPITSSTIGANPTGSTATGGTCGEVGDTKTGSVPLGFRGTVQSICQPDGTWKEISDLTPVECPGGKVYLETKAIPCPTGFTTSSGGTDQVQQCNAEGVWVITDQCSTLLSNEDCSLEPSGKSRTLPCPYGQTGQIVQTCTNNVWTQDAASSTACTTFQCDGVDIGTTRTQTSSDANCSSAGYKSGGTTEEICTQSGWQPVANNCVEEDLSILETACIEGTATERYKCPAGEMGTYYRKCIGTGSNAKWKVINNCKPSACGEDAIGTVRTSSFKCPNNKVGELIEICGNDGKWRTDEQNCTLPECPARNDITAIWPNGIAGEGATAIDCASGYVQSISGTNPTRYCSVTGIWSDTINNNCIQTCNQSHAANALWPTTSAGSSATIAAGYGTSAVGTCDNGFHTPTTITRPCNADGTWGTPTGGTCNKYCPPTTYYISTFPHGSDDKKVHPYLPSTLLHGHSITLTGANIANICNPGSSFTMWPESGTHNINYHASDITVQCNNGALQYNTSHPRNNPGEKRCEKFCESARWDVNWGVVGPIFSNKLTSTPSIHITAAQMNTHPYNQTHLYHTRYKSTHKLVTFNCNAERNGWLPNLVPIGTNFWFDRCETLYHEVPPHCPKAFGTYQCRHFYGWGTRWHCTDPGPNQPGRYRLIDFN